MFRWQAAPERSHTAFGDETKRQAAPVTFADRPCVPPADRADSRRKRRSKNQERLARWLLLGADRIDGNELPITHKFLALMLGVQRPAVTVAVQALERKGLIKAGREVITITDRKRLVEMSNGTYLPP
jgi:CRP-like cAMP-binding protein